MGYCNTTPQEGKRGFSVDRDLLFGGARADIIGTDGRIVSYTNLILKYQKLVFDRNKQYDILNLNKLVSD